MKKSTHLLTALPHLGLALCAVVWAAAAWTAVPASDPALAKTKGAVSDVKALAAAMRAADFPSVRGKFKFNTNNFPVQDFYVFEVVKDTQGQATLKTIGKPLVDAADAYVAQCPMKS